MERRVVSTLTGLSSAKEKKVTKIEYVIHYRSHQDKKLPDFGGSSSNHEIEIILHGYIHGYIDSDIVQSIHAHKGLDDKYYVCYPPSIATWDDVIRIISMWHAITFFQIEYSTEPNILEQYGRWICREHDLSFNPFEEYQKFINDTCEISCVVDEL